MCLELTREAAFRIECNYTIALELIRAVSEHSCRTISIQWLLLLVNLLMGKLLYVLGPWCKHTMATVLLISLINQALSKCCSPSVLSFFYAMVYFSRFTLTQEE